MGGPRQRVRADRLCHGATVPSCAPLAQWGIRRKSLIYKVLVSCSFRLCHVATASYSRSNPCATRNAPPALSNPALSPGTRGGATHPASVDCIRTKGTARVNSCRPSAFSGASSTSRPGRGRALGRAADRFLYLSAEPRPRGCSRPPTSTGTCRRSASLKQPSPWRMASRALGRRNAARDAVHPARLRHQTPTT
jgi:hypothetical protein